MRQIADRGDPREARTDASSTCSRRRARTASRFGRSCPDCAALCGNSRWSATSGRARRGGAAMARQNALGDRVPTYRSAAGKSLCANYRTKPPGAQRMGRAQTVVQAGSPYTLSKRWRAPEGFKALGYGRSHVPGGRPRRPGYFLLLLARWRRSRFFSASLRARSLRSVSSTIEIGRRRRGALPSLMMRV